MCVLECLIMVVVVVVCDVQVFDGLCGCDE